MKKITKACIVTGALFVVVKTVLAYRRCDIKRECEHYALVDEKSDTINESDFFGPDKDTDDSYEFDNWFDYCMLCYALRVYGLSRDDVCIESVIEKAGIREMCFISVQDNAKYIVKGSADTMNVAVEKYLPN